MSHRPVPLALALWLPLCALLGGCPVIGDALPDVPLGAAPEYALPDGTAPPDASGGDGPALDGAPPDSAAPDARPADAGPADADPRLDAAPCSPGDPLGLCAVCGDDGEAVMPEDDPGCPALDCEALNLYERATEGGEAVCYVERRVPLAGACRAVGACHDDPQVYCTVRRYEERTRVPPGACVALAGCIGAEPPRVELADRGTRCNRLGTCDGAGACTAYGPCEAVRPPANSFLCAARDWPQPYCEFYLEFEEGIACRAFCADAGWDCVDAWNTMRGVCEHPDPGEGCDTVFGSFVCRCAP